MCAQDVATMWKNTRVFVAFPKDNDWQKAMKNASGVAKALEEGGGGVYNLF